VSKLSCSSSYDDHLLSLFIAPPIGTALTNDSVQANFT
jgi:hypothetical protein